MKTPWSNLLEMLKQTGEVDLVHELLLLVFLRLSLLVMLVYLEGNNTNRASSNDEL